MSGSSAEALSIGWPTAVSPADVTSPAAAGESIQYGRCWKAYVGRSTRRAPRSANTAAQSTSPPQACSRERAVSSAVTSGTRRRSDGIRVWPAGRPRPVSSRHSAAIEVRSVPGPTSTKREQSSSARPATPSRNRTACRACRTQYSGSASTSAPTGRPVRSETKVSCGSVKARRATTARSSSIAGSISGEWKAWLTRSQVAFPPAASKPATTPARAPRSPDSTVAAGPLTAAREISSSWPSIRAAASASEARSATIAPPAGSRCMIRPRTEASSAASASDRAPAVCTAASAPTECPRTASGRTPHDSRSRNRATSNANTAGCV